MNLNLLQDRLRLRIKVKLDCQNFTNYCRKSLSYQIARMQLRRIIFHLINHVSLLWPSDVFPPDYYVLNLMQDNPVHSRVQGHLNFKWPNVPITNHRGYSCDINVLYFKVKLYINVGVIGQSLKFTSTLFRRHPRLITEKLLML